MAGPTSSYATARIARDSLDHTSPTTIVKVMQSPGGDDLHLQDVLLNIAQCVIHTYRVLCWTLLCVRHTYRVLCWTLLSVWYTPAGCFVRHCSHIYRVLCWTLLFDIHLQGVLLDIAGCVIYIYRLHCRVCDTHLQNVVLNIAQCVTYTYRVLCWTLLSVWCTPTGCCVDFSSVCHVLNI